MWVNDHARLEVHDLVARFCSYLDRGLGKQWAELFLSHASFECVGYGNWCGTEQLALVPGLLKAQAKGDLRHLVSAVIIEPTLTWRKLEVEAYGPVVDFEHEGDITCFYDYSFHLRFVSRWKIYGASARIVGAGSPKFGHAPKSREAAPLS